MQEYYIGLMSGTSADGVDGVLVSFDKDNPTMLPCFHHHVYSPFPIALRENLIALNQPGWNDLEQSMQLAIHCVNYYALVVEQLRHHVDLPPKAIRAIGAHGQTVRHRPDLGYSLQINHPSLLAERTGITVVADFRQRDIAAGGQGAPLVPSFHAYLWQHPTEDRLILNLGGISNLTWLPAQKRQQAIIGFDCGPANALLDSWYQKHFYTGDYDQNGAWAATGHVLPDLYTALLTHPFFGQPYPKSTGRDVFHLDWVQSFLSGQEHPEDVQATLLALTVETIRQQVDGFYDPTTSLTLYVCGGGAYNQTLMHALERALPHLMIDTTQTLGLPPEHVEAAAFAWLAYQTVHARPATLPSVTGATGARILGAIYPA